MKPTRFNRFYFLSLCAMSAYAHAGSLTWDGNGGTAPNPNGGAGTWDANTTANWWNGTSNVVWPAPGGTDDDAVFTNTAGTVTIDAGGVTANDLTFNTTGYILSGGVLTLNGTTPTITTATSVTSTINSVVDGSSGLLKAGAGTLILTGANIYTGTTTISGGALHIGNGGATGSLGSGNIVNNGSLFFNRTGSYTVTNTISGSGTLYARGGGTMTIGGTEANTFTGGLDLYQAGGTTVILDKADGVTAVAGNIRIGTQAYGSTGYLQLASSEQIADTSIMTLHAFHHTAGGVFSLMGNNETIGGLVAGVGGNGPGTALVRNQGTADSVLTLNTLAGNTYSFSAGNLGKAAISNGSTGRLSIVKNGDGTQIFQGTINYTGTTTINAGTLSIRGGTTFNTSATTLAGGTLDIQSSTVNAAIAGTSGSVTVTGGANSNFGGGNKSYSGNTTISGASTALTQTAANSLSANSIHSIGTGSTLNTGNFAGSIKALTGAGNVVLGTTTAARLTLTDGASQSFSGVLSGAGGITKIGGGTQTLSGTNTYTGITQINGGILLLDFAAGGTSNILGSSTALALDGGTLELKGGSGEANTQTLNGVSGIGTLQLTQNGATSINATLGTISSTGLINFAGGNTTVAGGLATAGSLNFITTTTAGLNDGNTRLGAHLWNGTGWASTATNGAATTYVVAWQGTTTNLTTDGNTANPTGDLSIQDGAGTGTSATYSSNTTVNSLLMGATTYSSTLNPGTNTLTVGNGAGALGAVAIANNAQSLTIGDIAGQGALTAGTSAAASILALNNQSATSTLTINSVIANNTAGGVVSLGTDGSIVLNAANTHTGLTTVYSGTLGLGHVNALQSSTLDVGTADSQAVTFNVAGTNTYLFGGLQGADDIAIGGNSLSIGGNNASTTHSGVISGTGGLTKTGSGTLILAGASTFSGPVTINGGTLSVSQLANGGSASSIGAATNSASNLVLNGATLTYTGGNTTTDRGFTVGTTGATLNASGTGAVTYGGSIALSGTNAARTLTLTGTNTGNNTLGGSLSDNGTGATSLTKTGAGSWVLTGNNTYTGTTTVSAAGILYLGSSGTAVPGNLTMSGPDQTYVRTLQANQFGSGSVLNMTSASGSWNRFELFGKSQTLAGITTGNAGTQGGGVIQNSETNGAAGANATLTLSGPGSYIYNGHLRDFGSPNAGTNAVALTKTGSGSQTLIGAVISYSGATTVSGGTLTLTNTTAFKSAINNSATVEFNITTATNFGTAVPLSGSGIYTKTGAATLQFNGTQAITATGEIQIQAGTLQNNNNAVNWTNNKADFSISSGAILDLFADPIYGDALTGAGTVQNNFGNTALGTYSGSSASLEKLVIGTNNGSGNFTGVIRNNSVTNALGSGVNLGGIELEKTGTGTQILSGANTYTGATTITAGTLQVDGSLAAGSTVGIGTAGTLSGTGTINGNATLTGNGIINKSSGNLAGTLGVTGGNWNGAGSVTGVVTSSSGTFTIGAGANLTANAGLNVTGGSIASGSGASTITGSVNYTSASNSSFGGVIAGSGKTLTMNSSAATLNLDGTNTYTGATTVTQGRLNINGSITSSTSVGAGATAAILGGDGTVTGDLIVGANGMLLPGQGGLTDRILNVTGNVTAAAGANVSFNITSEASMDRLVVGGSMNLNNFTLLVEMDDTSFTELGIGMGDEFLAELDTFNPANASYYKLVSGTTTGMFSNVTDTMDASTLSYYGLTGTQYTTVIEGKTFWVAQGSSYLVAIPEPRAALLGGLGLLALLRRRRSA